MIRMQVTTGRHAARAQLLSRLALGAGALIILITCSLIWTYGWMEARDLREQKRGLHQRLALSLLGNSATGLSSELGAAVDFQQASFILARRLFGPQAIGGALWVSPTQRLAQGGSPLESFPPSARPLFEPSSTPRELQLFHEMGKQRFYSSLWSAQVLGRPIVLELRSDLSEDLGRVERRRDQILLSAIILEGALIALLFWVARRADARLMESERDQLAMESELFFLAHYDTLTHLPNRALFWERLDAATSRASRLGKSVALLLFDVNGFSKLNDELGRSQGDLCLVECARRAQASARAADLVCRIGPDEFAIVLEDLEPSRALDAAQRLLVSIQRQFSAPLEIEGLARPIILSLTGGGSRFPQDGFTSEELLAHAQAALAKAKSEQSAFVFFQDPEE